MNRPILPLGAVISNAFRTFWANKIWFFAVPIGLSLVSTLTQSFLGFIPGMLVGLVTGALTVVVVTAGALAHRQGKPIDRDGILHRLLPRTIGVLAYMSATTLLLIVLAYGLWTILLSNPSPELIDLIRLYWQILQGDGQEVNTILTAVRRVSPEELMTAFNALVLILAFLLLLSFVFLALFAPIYAVIVGEDLGLAALGRSFSLSQGYRLKIIGIVLVLFLILLGMTFVFIAVIGLISVPLTDPETLQPSRFLNAVLSSLSAPLTAWVILALAHLYSQLRQAKGESLADFETTFE